MHLLLQGVTYHGIDQFQDSRYLSASEAVWKAFAFDILQFHQSENLLGVHLSVQHTFYFSGGDEEMAAQKACAGTKLTG